MAVNESEFFVEQLSKNSFFSPWCFPNLFIKKGNVAAEFCDLVVVFGNVVILFSEKDISFNADAAELVAWKRWFKKSVAKSADQLIGAAKCLRRGSTNVYSDAKFQRSLQSVFPKPEDLAGC
ncbi:hypothetical protein [Roseicella aerolata]|uniref:Uncharacterized protein n=1 Tax=Roseicella aerolata TaxID=2883479 RepID=A0A9X1IEP5_9PROT|nr:hypothetical protein [Roseicella aerolata]MCB4822348.1 hypothetical protein [Roseicella aerolata]